MWIQLPRVIGNSIAAAFGELLDTLGCNTFVFGERGYKVN